MPETLTVGQLIELLGRFDPKLPVRTEGCDCVGEVHEVGLYGGEVVVCRSPDEGNAAYHHERRLGEFQRIERIG
jgi:hypothetical protein